MATITKYHGLDGFKEQKFIFLQFWMLEVQGQGGRQEAGLVFSWGLSPWLVDDGLALSLHGPFSVHNPDVSSYYKDISVIGLGPYLYDFVEP